MENQGAPICKACGGPCTGNCWKKPVVGGGVLLLVSGSLLVLALFASTIKEYQFIGRDAAGEYTTISVDGEGEAYATPDIAHISFSITQESKTVAEARKIVDEKMKKIHEFLLASSVEKKDIKATYSLYPKMEWQQKQIQCITYPCIQPPGKEVLIGYVVTESVEVKVRNLEKNADAVGAIVGGLADNGATNMSGPNFMLEDEDGVKALARKDAITQAKTKAEVLAKELGVTLVRITSFNEGGNYPVFYGRGGDAMMKTMSVSAEMAPAPAVIPAGENKYTSNVTITYEVR